MRKLISILLILGMVLAAGNAFAVDSLYTRIRTFVSVRGSASTSGGSALGDTVPLTSISIGDRILGFAVIPNTGTQGAVAGLYDFSASTDALAASGATDSNIFAEAETATNSTTNTLWFPYPYRLDTQLQILRGSADCTVLVYYIDASDVR